MFDGAVTPFYAPGRPMWLRTLSALLVAVGLVGSAIGQDEVLASRNVALVEEVWQLVDEHFFDPTMNGVDWNAARERYSESAHRARTERDMADVIRGMLAELQTSHTAYYTPAQPEYYQLLDVFSAHLADEIEARFPDGRVSYPGIGIFTRVIDGRPHVTGIVAGTPASRSELDVGDAILAADGAPFEPVGSFEGKVGIPVTLTVQKSADTKERLAVTVVPERIHPTTMFLQAIEAGAKRFRRDGVSVGYVRIWSYAGEHYHQALVDQLQGKILQGADALVLDLRDGWGGANPAYLNLFNRDVPVLTMRGRDGEPTTFDSQWRKPAVLLVNRGTRSGKEVLAYGFKAFGLGPVVGTRTAGAVVAGKPFVLADGSLLFLAVRDVTVDGLRLEGVGVEPDTVVPFDVRYSAGADPQLERALAVAAERVTARRR